MSSLQISIWGESDLGDDEFVCSFAFADLRHDGFLSLVAGLGTTGRGFCSTVYIVDKTASSFEVYLYGGSPDSGAGDGAAVKIKDIGRDGKFEFLVVEELGSIKSQCVATWTAIYAWTGGGYTNVSRHFENFYRERLDTLDREVAAIQPLQYQGSSYEPAEKECLRAEAEGIRRFLGVSPEAGLDQAIDLAKSNDWAKRNFATEILGDIGTPPARKVLALLAKDSNHEVASGAEYCLSLLSKGPIEIVPAAFQRLRLQKPILSH